MVAGELVPITFFVAAAAVLIAWTFFRHQRTLAESSGGGDYRRLAEEAVRGQQTLLEEIKHLNQTMKEIERLLKEV